jgi:hypothetical protein
VMCRDTQGASLVAEFQQVIQLRVKTHCVTVFNCISGTAPVIMPAITGLPRPPADA